jgi:hypothetical protein
MTTRRSGKPIQIDGGELSEPESTHCPITPEQDEVIGRLGSKLVDLFSGPNKTCGVALTFITYEKDEDGGQVRSDFRFVGPNFPWELIADALRLSAQAFEEQMTTEADHTVTKLTLEEQQLTEDDNKDLQ